MTLEEYEIEKINDFKKLNGGKIRVAYYCRKSQKDATENSIDTQINNLDVFRKEIERDLGEKVQFDPDFDIYSEDDRSGTNTEFREEFNRMIASTTRDNKGYYTAILVYKEDRFSRNTQDTLFFRTLLMDNNCILLSRDIRDKGDPVSELTLTLMSALNEYYAKNNTTLVVNGMMNLAKKGKCIFSLPYGLTKDADKNIHVVEEEAKVVRKIFELARNNSSVTDIYDYLKQNNIKRRDGSEFGKTTIHGMLHNEKYIGTYVWSSESSKYRRMNNRKRVYRKNIPEYRFDDYFEAIVDKKVFYEVQDILESCRNSHRKSMCGDGYILYNLVFCGDCGTKMYGSSHVGGKNHVKKRYYECRGRAKHLTDCHTKNINADYLENLTKDMVFKVVKALFDKNNQKIIDKCKESLSDLSEKIERCESEILDYNKKIDRLVDFQMENPSLSKIYGDKIIKCNTEIEKLNELLATSKAEYESSSKKIEYTISKGVIRKEDLFADDLSSKRIINSIIKRIEINNDNIKFVFNDNNDKNC